MISSDNKVSYTRPRRIQQEPFSQIRQSDMDGRRGIPLPLRPLPAHFTAVGVRLEQRARTLLHFKDPRVGALEVVHERTDILCDRTPRNEFGHLRGAQRQPYSALSAVRQMLREKTLVGVHYSPCHT